MVQRKNVKPLLLSGSTKCCGTTAKLNQNCNVLLRLRLLRRRNSVAAFDVWVVLPTTHIVAHVKAKLAATLLLIWASALVVA